MDKIKEIDKKIAEEYKKIDAIQADQDKLSDKQSICYDNIKKLIQEKEFIFKDMLNIEPNKFFVHRDSTYFNMIKIISMDVENVNYVNYQYRFKNTTIRFEFEGTSESTISKSDFLDILIKCKYQEISKDEANKLIQSALDFIYQEVRDETNN